MENSIGRVKSTDTLDRRRVPLTMMTSIPLVAPSTKSYISSSLDTETFIERTPALSAEEEQQIRDELEVPAESRLVTRFACSLKSEKNTFPGYSFLFSDALRFRSDSQARMVMVSTCRTFQGGPFSHSFFFYFNCRWPFPFLTSQSSKPR